MGAVTVVWGALAQVSDTGGDRVRLLLCHVFMGAAMAAWAYVGADLNPWVRRNPAEVSRDDASDTTGAFSDASGLVEEEPPPSQEVSRFREELEELKPPRAAVVEPAGPRSEVPPELRALSEYAQRRFVSGRISGLGEERQAMRATAPEFRPSAASPEVVLPGASAPPPPWPKPGAQVVGPAAVNQPSAEVPRAQQQAAAILEGLRTYEIRRSQDSSWY